MREEVNGFESPPSEDDTVVASCSHFSARIEKIVADEHDGAEHLMTGLCFYRTQRRVLVHILFKLVPYPGIVMPAMVLRFVYLMAKTDGEAMELSGWRC